jgi:hypothetical protein
MAALSLVGGQSHPYRPRRPRADVFYGAGAAPSATSCVGFGEAPPLRHRPRGAYAAEAAGAVETVWVRCHICAQMYGNPAIVVHEPQCYQKWRTREFAKPPSRRLPPPERPALDCSLEEYNVQAQASSDRCCLCPCPKCGRTFLPERLQAHVRSCEEESQLGASEPPFKWGPVHEVGAGWSMEELQRFCHNRRLGSAQQLYERNLKSVGERIKHSPAVKRDSWDINGLSKRELIAKVNRNLAASRAATDEDDLLGLENFRSWLGTLITRKQTASRVFSRRLIDVGADS